MFFAVAFIKSVYPLIFEKWRTVEGSAHLEGIQKKYQKINKSIHPASQRILMYHLPSTLYAYTKHI